MNKAQRACIEEVLEMLKMHDCWDCHGEGYYWCSFLKENVDCEWCKRIREGIEKLEELK